MSDTVNTELFERAAEAIDYFEGKLPAQLIEKDLERNDLEQLRYHVQAAEGLIAQQEMERGDVL